MAAPTQLNITLAISGNPVVTFPISAALQTLDSGHSGGQGQASGQTGYSSVDEAVRNIMRGGGFWTTVTVSNVPTKTFYSTAQIVSITYQ